jgi:hypothetical protein
VVECLPSKCETLRSNPKTTKKEKKGKERKGKGKGKYFQDFIYSVCAIGALIYYVYTFCVSDQYYKMQRCLDRG